MNILVLFAVLLTTVCTASTVREEQAATVLVTNEGLLGGGRGTGVILDPTHVLTCAHMIHTAKDELFVYTHPLKEVVTAYVDYIDERDDLAVLVLSRPVQLIAYPQFEIHWTEGDPITVVGNALGSMKWLVTRGVLAGQDHGYLLTDARINPGNSGGPWFNEDGDIVAITDWGIGPVDSEEGINGGISAATIETFLARRAKDQKGE